MMSVVAADIERARIAIADVARHTPVLASATLTDRLGAPVVLKAESLQRTGSFKIRGALNKVAALGDGCAGGVVCGSAGNHAQALAFAAQERGLTCEVFMPDAAAVAKVEGAEALGARVVRGGAGVDACIAAAQARADEVGMVFVHPFDDPDVIAGQGTLGLELLEDVPDLGKLLVPVGGGGLAAGVAIAIKSARPGVEIVGVRVDPTLTIADGIAVKQPGAVTGPLLEKWLDDVVRVEEDDVAEAIVLLLERAKLVVEGAGAVGVAALVAGLTAPAREGATAVILSGGNVDAGLLAEVARHHETVAGRRLVLATRVADRPGALAGLLAVVGSSGANLLEVGHVREGIDLHVRETGVQLVLETRGREHAAAVLAAIAAAGYPTDGYSGVT
jgi:threonine dehydratase